MREFPIWSCFLVFQGLVMLACSVLSGDPVGLAPGALSLALSLVVLPLERACRRV